jgi:serine-type D-Ala-D-Ala carboxypeptidase (penicillin-binding protein 5/6)
MALRLASTLRIFATACLLVGVSAHGFAAASKSTAKPPAQAVKPPPKKDEPQIVAPHAILIEAESGSVLFERDADVLIFPASLAKLMTTEYVFHEIKEGHIKLTDEYTVSENAWRKGGAPSRSSTMFAVLYSHVSVDDLLHAVIIQSANDACIVLAEGIAGSETEFAAKMTQRAREIGLPKSVFTNSNGLPDPGTKMTTRELGMLARSIIHDYPDFYPLYGEREFTWNKIRQQNRNPLLGTLDGADGLKTGFTNDAGYGIVGSAVQSGIRLIAVVNGEKTAKERAEEAKKLLEWGFHNFEQRMLFAEGQIIGEAKVFGGSSEHVPLVAPGLVQLMVPKNGSEKLVARIVYNGPVPAPVAQGITVGTLKVWRNDNVVLQVPLKTAESVPKGNLSQRAFDAVAELIVSLFRAGAERL